MVEVFILRDLKRATRRHPANFCITNSVMGKNGYFNSRISGGIYPGISGYPDNPDILVVSVYFGTIRIYPNIRIFFAKRDIFPKQLGMGNLPENGKIQKTYIML